MRYSVLAVVLLTGCGARNSLAGIFNCGDNAYHEPTTGLDLKDHEVCSRIGTRLTGQYDGSVALTIAGNHTLRDSNRALLTVVFDPADLVEGPITDVVALAYVPLYDANGSGDDYADGTDIDVEVLKVGPEINGLPQYKMRWDLTFGDPDDDFDPWYTSKATDWVEYFIP
jgi:hypothetical protein